MTNIFLTDVPSRQALGLLRCARACAHRVELGNKIYTDLVVPFATDTTTTILQLYTDYEIIDQLSVELRRNAFATPSSEYEDENGNITITINGTWVLYENLNGASLRISPLESKITRNSTDFTFKTLLWRLDHLVDPTPIHRNAAQFEVFLKTARITDLCGRGKSDLSKKLLKFSQQPEEVFRQWPLRMLEAVSWGSKGFLMGDAEYEAILKCGDALYSIPGEKIAQILLSDLAFGCQNDPEAPYIWLEELKLGPIVRKAIKNDQAAAKFMRKGTKLLPKDTKKWLRKHGF